ncbi:hypothetical protein PLESTF_001183800, partial [Pleodorina starrii]
MYNGSNWQPTVKNYNFTATIAPTNDNETVPTNCLTGFSQVQCSDRLTPGTPPSPAPPPRPPAPPSPVVVM